MSSGIGAHGSSSSPATNHEQRAFGEYLLVEKLGEGAMGAVYKAKLSRETGFIRHFALKVINPQHSNDERYVDLLISEARVGGLLEHPNIIKTLDLKTHQGQVYMVMEYVDGVPLGAVLRRHRAQQLPIPLDITLQLMIEVCIGLDYAHRAVDDQGQPLQMVHRDLKPQNIMLSRNGEVKVCDFGVARAASRIHETTAMGVAKGTVAYMSQEQAQGRKDLDRRSDVFSAGAVLFELLTLEQLNRAETAEVVFIQAGSKDFRDRLELLPESPIREGLEQILARAIAPRREDRHATAAELVGELKQLRSRLNDPADLRAWCSAECEAVRALPPPAAPPHYQMTRPASWGSLGSTPRQGPAEMSLQLEHIPTTIDALPTRPTGLSLLAPADPPPASPTDSSLPWGRPLPDPLPPAPRRLQRMMVVGTVALGLALGTTALITQRRESTGGSSPLAADGMHVTDHQTPAPGLQSSGTSAVDAEPSTGEAGAVHQTGHAALETAGATDQGAAEPSTPGQTAMTPSASDKPLPPSLPAATTSPGAGSSAHTPGAAPPQKRSPRDPGAGHSAGGSPSQVVHTGDDATSPLQRTPAGRVSTHTQTLPAPPETQATSSRPPARNDTSPESPEDAAAPDPAFLYANALPCGTIQLDDRTIMCPSRHMAVAPGSHVLRFQGADGSRLERAIRLEPGATLRCVARLKTTPAVIECEADDRPK